MRYSVISALRAVTARVVASHFSVIVRGTAQLFVAGPPVVAAAPPLMRPAPVVRLSGGLTVRGARITLLWSIWLPDGL